MSIPTIDLREPARDRCSTTRRCVQLIWVHAGHRAEWTRFLREMHGIVRLRFALDEETKLAVAIPDGGAYG